MSQKLTDIIIKALPLPAKGNKVYYDTAVKGFGCRITKAGSRSFILNYRTRYGRERRYTIGQFPDWKTTVARTEAADLKRQINTGIDPLSEIEAGRNAKTMEDLCKRFQDEHFSKVRPATQRYYVELINRKILPALKNKPVADVTYSDIDAIHQNITKSGAAYLANRTVAVL
jgi:hypothetical protein